MWDAICKACTVAFAGKTPQTQYCGLCQKCLQCSQILKPHQSGRRNKLKFCSSFCFGKWNSTNNPKVQAAIKRNGVKGREAAWKAMRGRPVPHMRGELSPHWKGGRGSERKGLMCKIEYKLWRKAVFERDDYTCQMCKKRGGILQADHIIPYVADLSKALDVNNGRTLCKPCHLLTPTWGTNARKFMTLTQ